MASDVGLFVLTGQDADLDKDVIVTLDAGSFALAGQEADFIVGEAVDVGHFALTGQDAAFYFTFNRRFEFDDYSQDVTTNTHNSITLAENSSIIIEEAYKEAA